MNKKEYDKERYEFFKSRGFCPACKTKVLDDRVFCLDCRIRMNANKKYTKESKERSSKRRKELASKGICYYCGKRKMEEGKRSCRVCRIRRTKKVNNKKELNELNNVCNKCGKRQRLPDKRVCEICYKVCMDRVDKMNKARSNKSFNHYWSKDNRVIFTKKI